jgi:hypothetical protein
MTFAQHAPRAFIGPWSALHLSRATSRRSSRRIFARRSEDATNAPASPMPAQSSPSIQSLTRPCSVSTGVMRQRLRFSWRVQVLAIAIFLLLPPLNVLRCKRAAHPLNVILRLRQMLCVAF